MVKSCVAYNCTNRFKKGSGITFHKFPLKNKERLNLWVNALKRDIFMPTIHHFICSSHFKDDCFERSYVNLRKLKDDAVPSLFDFPEHLKKNSKPRKQPKERDSLSGSVVQVNEIQPFAENDHNYYNDDSPRKVKRKYENILNQKEKALSEARKKIKVLKTTCERRRQKILSLTDLFQELKTKKLYNDNIVKMLEENFGGIPFELLKKIANPRQAFSEELKSFASSLYYYSPSAYRYVRKCLNLALPHPWTIRKWYSSIKGNVGFTQEAFAAIQSRVQQASHPIYVALIFDEMSIRKRIDWDGKEFFGYTTLVEGVCHDHVSEAKEALVLMVVSINASWSLPIRYFLVDGLSASEKAIIIHQSLLLLHDTGCTVISLTFDGTSTNFAVAGILGAKMDPLNLTPHFKNPAENSQKIVVYPDPCHMVKLVRNLFASMSIRDNANRKVDFSYIKKLNEIQESEGLHLANKVTRSHIEWNQQKMKVSLAVQVLSSSVAQALICVEKDLKLKQFKDSAATSNFCSIFDRLFDLANSKNPLAKGYKAVLRKSNQCFWQPFLKDSYSYLMSLKNEAGIPIYSTKKKTGIIGFMCIIKSIEELFDSLVLSDKLKYLGTYKMSQDNVEMFFCRIRQRGGFNNNPSAVQFRAAYRQLLVKNDIQSTNTANVIPQDTSILSWLTTAEEKISLVHNDAQSLSRMRLLESNFCADAEDISDMPEFELSDFVENIVTYIAGFVVKKLLSRVNCFECSETLICHEFSSQHKFLNRRNFGGLKTPSQSVIKVCTVAEKSIRLMLLRHDGKPSVGNTVKQTVVSEILHNLLGVNLFEELHEHSLENVFPENHIISLIRGIIDEYIKVRFHYICKTTNLKLKGKSVRQKFTKLTLFKNQ